MHTDHALGSKYGALLTASVRGALPCQVGFESEFILLDAKAKQHHGPHAVLPPAIDHSVYCLSSAMDAAATGEQQAEHK